MKPQYKVTKDFLSRDKTVYFEGETLTPQQVYSLSILELTENTTIIKSFMTNE